MTIEDEAGQRPGKYRRSPLDQRLDVDRSTATLGIHDPSRGDHGVADTHRSPEANLGRSKHHVGMVDRQHCRMVGRTEYEPTVDEAFLVHAHHLRCFEAYGRLSVVQMIRFAAQSSIDQQMRAWLHGRSIPARSATKPADASLRSPSVNLQDFLVTKTGTKLAIRLSTLIPRRLAYAVLRPFTRRVARKDSRLTRTIRENLSVVLDTSPDDPSLDAVVAEVLFGAAVGNFDFFHGLGLGHEKTGRMVSIDPKLWDAFEEAKRQRRGLVVVAPHLATLDIGGLAFIGGPYEVQVLSAALPPGGYEVVNGLRETEGLVLTPSSQAALGDAEKRLRNGGFAFTAVDRPPPRSKRADRIEFFGKPARLWRGWAELAAGTDSLLILGWMERLPDRRYVAHIGELLDPRDYDHDPDRLARATLDQVEEAIRAHPEQWSMFLPVWPEEKP